MRENIMLGLLTFIDCEYEGSLASGFLSDSGMIIYVY